MSLPDIPRAPFAPLAVADGLLTRSRGAAVRPAWRGVVVGEPRSHVQLVLSPFGTRGLIKVGDRVDELVAMPSADGDWETTRTWIRDARDYPLEAGSRTCGTTGEPRFRIGGTTLGRRRGSSVRWSSPEAVHVSQGASEDEDDEPIHTFSTATYTAKLAIATDYACFAHFNGAGALTSYVALGSSSTVGAGASDPATTAYVPLLVAELQKSSPTLTLTNLGQGGARLPQHQAKLAEMRRITDAQLQTLAKKGIDRNYADRAEFELDSEEAGEDAFAEWLNEDTEEATESDPVAWLTPVIIE